MGPRVSRGMSIKRQAGPCEPWRSTDTKILQPTEPLKSVLLTDDSSGPAAQETGSSQTRGRTSWAAAAAEVGVGSNMNEKAKVGGDLNKTGRVKFTVIFAACLIEVAMKNLSGQQLDLRVWR